MHKELPYQLAEYLIIRDRIDKELPSKLSVCSMEFSKADRIISDAISQAVGVLCAVQSTADRVEVQSQLARQETAKELKKALIAGYASEDDTSMFDEVFEKVLK